VPLILAGDHHFAGWPVVGPAAEVVAEIGSPEAGSHGQRCCQLDVGLFVPVRGGGGRATGDTAQGTCDVMSGGRSSMGNGKRQSQGPHSPMDRHGRSSRTPTTSIE